jgi:hypothetical protein
MEEKEMLDEKYYGYLLELVQGRITELEREELFFKEESLKRAVANELDIARGIFVELKEILHNMSYYE